MTETTCCGSLQAVGSTALGQCGGPMAGMTIRLINWEEVRHHPTN